MSRIYANYTNCEVVANLPKMRQYGFNKKRNQNWQNSHKFVQSVSKII